MQKVLHSDGQGFQRRDFLLTTAVGLIAFTEMTECRAEEVEESLDTLAIWLSPGCTTSHYGGMQKKNATLLEIGRCDLPPEELIEAIRWIGCKAAEELEAAYRKWKERGEDRSDVSRDGDES